jgi:hypothetical protein
MESELVIARLIDEPRRFTVNDPSSTVYGLQQGTEYYELVVVEESFCNYDGTPVMEQPESNSDNINNSNL